MKKFVLLAIIATVATVANAQKIFAPVDMKVSCKMPSQSMSIVSQAPAFMKDAATATSMKKTALRKAEGESDGIYGTWIMNSISTSGDSSTDATWEATAVEVPETCEFTISVPKNPMVDSDGNTLNCYIEGIVMGFANVYGNFDPTTNVLTIPIQQCYSHSSYGSFEVMNIVEQNGGMYFSEKPITFTYDPELNTFDQDDAGIAIFMADYYNQTKPETIAECIWTISFDNDLYPVNATMQYYMRKFVNGKWDASWTPYVSSVYVDDWGFSSTIYNVFDMSTIYCEIDMEPVMGEFSVMLSEDKTITSDHYFNISIPNLQPISPLSLKDEANATTGFAIMLVGATEDSEGYLRWDYAKENAATGYLIRNYLMTDDESYMYGASYEDAMGAFVSGIYTGFTIEKFDNFAADADADGIRDIKPTLEESIKNRKVYNLQGQLVNKNAKGILVREGKKFLNK